MNKTETIDATQAHEKVRRGQADLVCAYDDARKCREILLDGAISLMELRAGDPPKDREIIFYCDSPGESVARQRAEEYRAQGYENTRVLSGGVHAWKSDAGYPMAVETPPENPPAA